MSPSPIYTSSTPVEDTTVRLSHVSQSPEGYAMTHRATHPPWIHRISCHFFRMMLASQGSGIAPHTAHMSRLVSSISQVAYIVKHSSILYTMQRAQAFELHA